MSRDVEVTWNGARAKLAARAGTAAGVTRAATRVQAVTIPRTPLDAGDLRSSIVVVPADAGDAQPTAQVGSDLVYAPIQHERLDFRHRSGRAKFLESALIDTADDVQRIIAADVRRSLEGGA